MTFQIPQNWRKDKSSQNCKWRSPLIGKGKNYNILDVWITVWKNSDFPQPPEDLMARDFLEDLKYEKEGRLKEVHFVNLDGIKGEFCLIHPDYDQNTVWISWSTYRYYKGKPQHIKLFLKSWWKDSDMLRKILNSAKLDEQ